jgi:hypothetical protein
MKDNNKVKGLEANMNFQDQGFLRELVKMTDIA